MYDTLIFFHSITRWFVLMALIYLIYMALRGIATNRIFSGFDNGVRHWTATIAHIELLLGILLYTQSPAVKSFFGNPGISDGIGEPLFFGLIHITLMLTAIVILTIGSAKAKRKTQSRYKFKTMLVYYSVALIVILIAIPWLFSPLAQRPYWRPF